MLVMVVTVVENGQQLQPKKHKKITIIQSLIGMEMLRDRFLKQWKKVTIVSVVVSVVQNNCRNLAKNIKY